MEGSQWGEFLERLKNSSDYRNQIVATLSVPAREPIYAEPEEPLHPKLQEALRQIGVERLYQHQAEACDAARRGENVAVFTPTASGKTLCYNLPVLDTLLKDPKARAFYLFPTKALAQDQLRKLQEFGLTKEFLASTYDGDTPMDTRRLIREHCRIVLTNPDMLHVGILPNHTVWAHFFRNLRFVVIDELHTYRGIFGIHFAYVIRRLRRICKLYGSEPAFICTSATLGNPEEALSNLIGLPFRIISGDASPMPAKTVVFWNPPFLDIDAGIRARASTEAVKLTVKLLSEQIRTIVFAKSRMGTELLLRYVRDQLAHEWLDSFRDKVMSYRAGYLPEERREIERKLFNGEILGVIATSALELGIDIGELEAAILVGYPGTIASTWQRAGRAGRQKEGLVILVATANPVDQHIVHNPEFLLRGAEPIAVSLRNPYISAMHLMCAAYELPLSDSDREFFGELFDPLVERLEEQGIVSKGERKFWLMRDRPHDDINIRSVAAEEFQILNRSNGISLGTAERWRVFRSLYPGAIYLHMGETYFAEAIDLTKKVVYVQPTVTDYYTVPMEQKENEVLSVWKQKPLKFGTAYLGELKVREQVIGFKRLRLFTDEVLSAEVLDLPPEEYETVGFWFCVDDDLVAELEGKEFHLMGSLHASEHASIALLPLVISADPDDVAGISYSPWHPDTRQPTVFIYDGFPGGAGFSEAAFERLDELLERTLETIVNCPCKAGCPSCVQSPRCGSENRPLDKWGAAFLLAKLLGRQVVFTGERKVQLVREGITQRV
ncbi:MAG: DEAD/DEAH box helicase [Armatimonadetes bacterium]|nr:DEAD/DEAH box helicase [Armatimonadota bacterium]MCX7969016.1 DEAD/DEAH box helicase [Armatimonadota bacterium]MDW8142561.1 DEAD/DEAH box helicase [Armatimonadota bacterium]